MRHKPVEALSYGLQKRVELARGLAMRPSVLLLDEPVAGMNREETEDMARFILDVQEEWGVTVVLVEHDMGMVMDISQHVAVAAVENPCTAHGLCAHSDSQKTAFSGSRQQQVQHVRKFHLLTKELDHDDGEVTATMKVKPSSIEKKYQAAIEEMFA